jgi:FAD/FMN-containing dehydrogenase
MFVIWQSGGRLTPRGGGMTLSRDSVEALRARFSGAVLEASDPGYDAARAIHNGMIDKRPTLIASCVNTADIADAVRFGRSEDLEISVRGGGHNPAGKAVTSGGLMINLAPMRGTYVDPYGGVRACRAVPTGTTTTGRPHNTGWRAPAVSSQRLASQG